MYVYSNYEKKVEGISSQSTSFSIRGITGQTERKARAQKYSMSNLKWPSVRYQSGGTVLAGSVRVRFFLGGNFPGDNCPERNCLFGGNIWGKLSVSLN